MDIRVPSSQVQVTVTVTVTAAAANLFQSCDGSSAGLGSRTVLTNKLRSTNDLQRFSSVSASCRLGWGRVCRESAAAQSALFAAVRPARRPGSGAES